MISERETRLRSRIKKLESHFREIEKLYHRGCIALVDETADDRKHFEMILEDGCAPGNDDSQPKDSLVIPLAELVKVKAEAQLPPATGSGCRLHLEAVGLRQSDAAAYALRLLGMMMQEAHTRGHSCGGETGNASGNWENLAGPNELVEACAVLFECGCNWQENETHGYWEGTCGLTWEFTTGTPVTNGFWFCPRCGRQVHTPAGTHRPCTSDAEPTIRSPEPGSAAKYKLRITASWPVGRKTQTLVRSLVWDNEGDAIACQSLMKKATFPKMFAVEFVRFVEEQPL